MGTPSAVGRTVRRHTEGWDTQMQRIKFAMYGKAALVVAALPTIALVAGAGRKFGLS